MNRLLRPALLGAALILLNVACGTGSGDLAAQGPPDAVRGAELFQNNCASCHGVDASGTEQGPSFLHAIYEPGHHGDEAFQRAAALGVQPHHWDFGAMPAVGQENGLTRAQVADIVAHVRALQRLAGIG